MRALLAPGKAGLCCAGLSSFDDHGAWRTVAVHHDDALLLPTLSHTSDNRWRRLSGGTTRWASRRFPACLWSFWHAVQLVVVCFACRCLCDGFLVQRSLWPPRLALGRWLWFWFCGVIDILRRRFNFWSFFHCHLFIKKQLTVAWSSQYDLEAHLVVVEIKSFAIERTDCESQVFENGVTSVHRKADVGLERVNDDITRL